MRRDAGSRNPPPESGHPGCTETESPHHNHLPCKILVPSTDGQGFSKTQVVWKSDFQRSWSCCCSQWFEWFKSSWVHEGDPFCTYCQRKNLYQSTKKTVCIWSRVKTSFNSSSAFRYLLSTKEEKWDSDGLFLHTILNYLTETLIRNSLFRYYEMTPGKKWAW